MLIATSRCDVTGVMVGRAIWLSQNCPTFQIGISGNSMKSMIDLFEPQFFMVIFPELRRPEERHIRNIYHLKLFQDCIPVQWFSSDFLRFSQRFSQIFHDFFLIFHDFPRDFPSKMASLTPGPSKSPEVTVLVVMWIILWDLRKARDKLGAPFWIPRIERI